MGALLPDIKAGCGHESYFVNGNGEKGNPLDSLSDFRDLASGISLYLYSWITEEEFTG